MSSSLYDLGRWCYRQRGRVIGAWLVLAVALAGLAVAIMRPMDDNFSIPGASSQTALNQLRMTFPEAADAGATMLVTVATPHALSDPDIRTLVEAGIAHLESEPEVLGSISPYNEYLSGRISSDGRTGMVGLRVEGSISTFTDAGRAVLDKDAAALQATLPPGSQVLMGGEVFAVVMPHLSLIEAVGVVVALVVLIMTLGSMSAGAIPLVTALVGVGVAMAVTFGATRFSDISSTTPMLGVMLGLAVGIDYALFILARHRDQMATGLAAEESTARAVATAGSAVVFAGLTVIIALIGLGVAGIPFLTVMGAYAAAAVAIGVGVALTLLPALMGALGERLRPRAGRRSASEPAARATEKAARGGVFGWWVRLVTAVPLLTIVIVVLGLGALSLPAKDLWLGLPNAGQLPQSTSARQTYDAVAQRFGPGHNGPLVITMQLVESTDPLGVLAGMRADIEALPGVDMVALATPNQNADTGMIQVIPTTAPDDPATEKVVQDLRDLAPRWQEKYHVTASVTGMTAVGLDVTQRLSDAMLPFGVFVVGLSLVLLTVVFRSIAVPLKAAIGYLLSVGGAFGATTLVFNKGWFASAINLHETTAVISFFPIITMGILFGLAMDYEVFLVSRMREEYVHGDSARAAVHDGFVHSAKVVTAAAIIMFAVFAFFVPNGEGPIKPIAFGLAVGVLIDAFVVRMTLVPAVMQLLGEKAWWLPRWLDRLLPQLDIEGESLAHQLSLADWPTADDNHAVVGEGVTISTSGGVLVDNLSLALLPGQALVVTGEPVARAALLLAIGGRLAVDEGRLKVLGHVLPDTAAKVRRRSLVLDLHSPHVARTLSAAREPLILIDDADQLHGQDRAALADLAADPGERTLVLGVTHRAAVDDLFPRGHLALDLTRPVAALHDGVLR